ncbi:IS66 family transposase [Paraburkholderia kirstenboschensis]
MQAIHRPEGILQADAYAGYCAAFEGGPAREAVCLAHCIPVRDLETSI